MTEKAKIQYVGQFYVHGSAAKKLDTRRLLHLPKTTLPLFRPNHAPVRYIEPVAIISLVMAVVLVCTMGLGYLQVRQDWEDYQEMRSHLNRLQAANAQLHREYRDAYDMEAVRAKAVGLGMVPVEEATRMTIHVTPPSHEPEPEMSIVQKGLLFWENLWA